ncbi:hypothetical protein Tco_0064466 [Tanacetum coccineum]
MSNMSEDIQYAGSDTRPPMLDRTDFESWQQRIRLYCLGKDNGENIMKSITEGPFQMGTMRDTLTEGGEGALHLGPERARVFADLSAEQKDRYKADIRATNILLQGIPKDIYTLINHFTDAKDIWDNVKMILEGSELTKDDRESQLYNDNDEFEHFLPKSKGETIHVSYQHEKYPTQSSESPQSSNQPSLVDKLSELWTQEAFNHNFSNGSDGRVEFKMGPKVKNNNANNQGRPYSEEQCQRKFFLLGMLRSDHRWQSEFHGQAKKTRLCYTTAKGNGQHSTRINTGWRAECCLLQERQVTEFDDDRGDFGSSMWTMSLKLINACIRLRYHMESISEVHESKAMYNTTNVEAPDFNSFFKIKNLEHQIQEKDNVIRDLKVLVSNVNDRSCEPYNANDVTDLLEQNERFRAEIEKVKQHYKELFESIKITAMLA